VMVDRLDVGPEPGGRSIQDANWIPTPGPTSCSVRQPSSVVGRTDSSPLLCLAWSERATATSQYPYGVGNGRRSSLLNEFESQVDENTLQLWSLS